MASPVLLGFVALTSIFVNNTRYIAMIAVAVTAKERAYHTPKA